jgi:twinkle protein
MNNAAALEQLGINLQRKLSGQIKTLCPKCSHLRKPHNKKEPCLSVNIDTGAYNCHNCDFTGGVSFQRKQKREYTKPTARLTKLGEKALNWFEQERKISNNTLLRMRITESMEWFPQLEQESTAINFNYYRNDELVNIKFRGANKSFKLAKDAELIFYNLDAVKNEREIIIVEGEIDALTLIECGIYNVISVPNGAPLKGEPKLEYLDNCIDDLIDVERFVIATDNDEAGRKLREELGRRLDKEKCFQVTYPEDCKDFNEVYVKHGKEAVVDTVINIKDWPLEGIIAMDDMFETVCDWYLNGYPKGDAAGIAGFDDLLTFAPGQLTTITGIPGHGKDEFMNWVMTSLAQRKEWSFAICGFEEPAPFTVTKLAEKISGKSFGFRKNKDARMSQMEFERSIGLIDLYFHFINIQSINASIDGILEKAFELVRRKGIRGLVINPYNCLEHNVPKGYSETQYVSELLTKITNFAVKSGVHVFLIAHPTKMRKENGKYEIPTLYHISGSAHFFNKSHNGFCVYRDYDTNNTTIHMQKVKWSWLGQLGYSSYHYNTETRQYHFLESSVKQEPQQQTISIDYFNNN